MSTDAETDETTPLAPDDAFAVLGNETRMDILQTLGKADEPLPFSELRDRVGMRDSGQFNYHLGKLQGHFIRKVDDEYELRGAGRRVVEAVLSGALTDDPVVEPTVIDLDCRLCGAPIELGFDHDRVRFYCTECDGLYDEPDRPSKVAEHWEGGYIGSQPLPPAGIKGRTPGEILKTTTIRGHLEMVSVAHGVCPRCSAVVEHSVQVCEDHDAEATLCDRCGKWQAIQASARCTNCIYQMGGLLLNLLVGNLDLRRFVADHGLDPIVDGEHWGWDYEEEVRSVDPFEAQITVPIGDDAISLTVDADPKVVEVEEIRGPESGC